MKWWCTLLKSKQINGNKEILRSFNVVYLVLARLYRNTLSGVGILADSPFCKHLKVLLKFDLSISGKDFKHDFDLEM